MKTNKFRVLSLDGGGLRGIFTCHVLDKLSYYLGEPLSSKFDLIIGTSTGSLIGGMISSNIPTSRILTLYKSLAKEVFVEDPNLINRCLRHVGLRPKFDIDKLESIILNKVGSHTLNELNSKYIAVAYDVKHDKPFFFKSWDKDMENIRLCDAMCMSSACPTLFPGREFMHKGIQHLMIDGGLGVCNPIMVGVIQGLKQGYSLGDIQVVSIGTGEEPYKFTLKDITEWGILQWAPKMTNILFSANDEVQTAVAKEILEPDNVFRFQVNLKDNPMGVVCPGTLASNDTQVINKFIELGSKYVLLNEVIDQMSNIQTKWLGTLPN